MSVSTVKISYVKDERNSKRIRPKPSPLPEEHDDLQNLQCQGTKIQMKCCQLFEEPFKRFEQGVSNEDDYVLSRIISNLDKPSKQEAYENSLMLSDWFMKVPEDFEENWIMIPCPPGKRMLIVASMEATRCFSKSGEFLFFFQSALPGGHFAASDESSKSVTILDCLWNHEKERYYVLDVLVWNTCHFVRCEAKFRFLWLQQKIFELGSSLEVSENNHYQFSFLPRTQCKKEEVVPTLSSSFLQDEFRGIDGILFYKGSAPYLPGVSSTVGWLKLFMIPEVFGIPASPVLLADCPDDYVDMSHYITDFAERRVKVTRKERAIRARRRVEKRYVGRFSGKGILKKEVREIVPKKEIVDDDLEQEDDEICVISENIIIQKNVL